MNKDSLMGGGQVDRMLQSVAQREATEQERRQEQVNAIQRAMQTPDVEETFRVAGIAIGVNDGQRVLVVATPDGRRREFPLSLQMENVLRQGLDAPLEKAA